MKEGFSVIIPTYNEEKILATNVKRLAKFLAGLRAPYEIVISDNGSTDGTPGVASELAEKYGKKIKAIMLRERGVGRAFRAAALAARYGRLVSLDADLTIDFRKFVPECLRLLRANSIVIGSKVVGSQHRPLARRLLSGGYIALSRALLGTGISDHSIGAKGYRRKDVMRFMDDIDAGSFYVTALAYRMSKSGKQIAEIPVMCNDTRPSKFNLAHEAVYRFRSLLGFWLREMVA